MKNVLLLNDYQSFDHAKNFYLFSNQSFFKNIDLKNQKIKYKTIGNLCQNYQSRYDERIETNRIIFKIEQDLYKSLNHFHSTTYSHRYWKIILGHWVARFVRIVYFRYKILDKCFNNDYKIDLVHVSKYDSYTQSIDQTKDVWLTTTDSEWNFNLFSKILIRCFKEKCDLNFIDTEKFQFTPNKSRAIDNTSKVLIKNRLLKILSSFNFLSQNNTMAFKSTYLNIFDELKLSLFNKEFPSILFNLDYKREKFNLINRKKIFLKKNEDILEGLIKDLIIDALPRVVVEDYKNILNIINNSKWPKFPKIIFTSNSYDGDDFFKIWAAEKVELKKSKYIIGQHGLFDSHEDLLKNSNDYQVCDHYLRWGEKKYEKDIEVFNFKLVNKKINFKKCNQIMVFVRTAGFEVETYSKHQEFQIYNNCLSKVLSNFNAHDLKETTLKLKHTFRETNPNELYFFKKKFPLLKIDEGVGSVYSLFEQTKLSIFLYFSTGVLESLSLDIPTVFYCPKKLVYIDPAEKKYLDILNKCKILSYNEEEFIDNINFIIKDVKKWWLEKEVINGKNEALNRYSKIGKKNSVFKIVNILKSLS